MSIKPIETKYQGRLFRSRLEARWAVFFDTLYIPWQYESEGYNINGTYYLPDFYLPKLDYIIEIKPGDPDDWEGLRGHPLLSCHFQLPTESFILKGEPSYTYSHYPSFGYKGYTPNDSEYLWCECPECGRYELQFEGRSGRVKCHRDLSDRRHNAETPRLLAAYQQASSARFER